ncbi:MAG: BTAD domain-containing putative transcriptional regulator [Pseudomonadota bacterium]
MNIEPSWTERLLGMTHTAGTHSAGMHIAGRALALRMHAYPEVFANGERLRVPLKHGLALLAFLAESTTSVSRTLAAQVLWPDALEDVGRTRLRRLVHNLNGLLGAALVTGDKETLWLAADVPFHADTAAARRASQALLKDSRSCAGAASAALAETLLQPGAGKFLEGFSLSGSDQFYDWMVRHRAEHERLLCRALVRLAEDCAAAGDTATAVQAAEQVLAVDSCTERAYVLLIGELGRLGDRCGVEKVYFQCADALRTELGVRPSDAVESAYAAATQLMARARPASTAAG